MFNPDLLIIVGFLFAPVVVIVLLRSRAADKKADEEYAKKYPLRMPRR